jgi:hypothetical protein
MTDRITIGPPGSILDWDNWGKPITDAVNEHDQRLNLPENGFSAVGAVESTASGTYVNKGGTSTFSFTKVLSTTRLFVVFASTFFTSAGTAGVSFALQIDGTDYEVSKLAATTTSGVHLQTAGSRYISGIAAGAKTIQLRWLRLGTGNTQTDGADLVTVSMRECV